MPPCAHWFAHVLVHSYCGLLKQVRMVRRRRRNEEPPSLLHLTVPGAGPRTIWGDQVVAWLSMINLVLQTFFFFFLSINNLISSDLDSRLRDNVTGCVCVCWLCVINEHALTMLPFRFSHFLNIKLNNLTLYWGFDSLTMDLCFQFLNQHFSHSNWLRIKKKKRISIE